MMKTFKIKKENKPEVKQWCLDNLGTENVRWWFHADVLKIESSPTQPDVLYIDVTEEEESQLMFFILKYE